MFVDQITGRKSKLGEACNKIVVEKREKIYFKWIWDEDSKQWNKEEVSRGIEIVKEINCTLEGLKLWEAEGSPVKMHPAVSLTDDENKPTMRPKRVFKTDIDKEEEEEVEKKRNPRMVGRR